MIVLGFLFYFMKNEVYFYIVFCYDKLQIVIL